MTYTVTLKGSHGYKIEVILALRQIFGMSLPEANAIVDNAPSVVAKGVSGSFARALLIALESRGAEVEVAHEA